jgi:hypothetical protein
MAFVKALWLWQWHWLRHHIIAKGVAALAMTLVEALAMALIEAFQCWK